MRAAVLVERHLGDPVAEQGIEYRIAIANIAVVREGLARVAGVVDEKEALRFGDRKRLQHKGIEDTQDDSVGAEAERQRADRDLRKAGAPSPPTQALPPLSYC